MKRFVAIFAVSLVTIFLLAACSQNRSAESKAFMLSEEVKIPETAKLVKVVKEAAEAPVVTASVANLTYTTQAKSTPAKSLAPNSQPKAIPKPKTAPVTQAPVNSGKLLILNKSTFTLKLYQNSQVIRTYLVTIGRDGHETPQGKFLIGNMIINPEYYGNSSGTVGYIPGGAPNNPLGSRWMGINYGPNAPDTYGFHEEFYQTGRKASSGCIRLFRADLEDLYNLISVGTPVWINP